MPTLHQTAFGHIVMKNTNHPPGRLSYLIWKTARCAALLFSAVFLLAGQLKAASLLVSLGPTVHRYDAASGFDQGSFASGFTAASGIGFDHVNGFVYVADFVANVVRKFDTSGAFLGNFGSGFTNPEDVAVDAAGAVYVSNYGASTVTKYNVAGALLTTLVVGGPPEGLGFATNGDLMVNHYGGSVLRHNGVSFSTFASGLTNNLPLAVDGSGNVYVAEYTGLKRILKYSSSGTLLTSISAGFSSYGMDFNFETGELLVGNNVPGNAINRYDTSLNFLGVLATPSSNPKFMTVIPEPSRVLLLMLGITGLAMRRRRM